MSPKHSHKTSAAFLNVSRFSTIGKEMISPSPSSYDTNKYKSIGVDLIQGGAPNNILALKKAENKFIHDKMFPFLVKDRLPPSKS